MFFDNLKDFLIKIFVFSLLTYFVPKMSNTVLYKYQCYLQCPLCDDTIILTESYSVLFLYTYFSSIGS